MRISDWSSDVCSSDLRGARRVPGQRAGRVDHRPDLPRQRRVLLRAVTAPDLDTERAGPLRDVRVLDLTRMIPGAMCTLLLADLGADVVKVEAPGFGDGNRRGFGFEAAHVAMNRGKRSLALDLRRTGAAPALRRLVGWAETGRA